MNVAVSVIIPTYNRRAMVREAVASVFAQRGVDFELIVVDDGSTDGTAEDLAELAETGRRQGVAEIQTMRTANRGVAAARNMGVRIAGAELIAFLDSDDLWAPSKLAKQVDFMRDNPQCQISQTGELWIRAGRRVNPGRRHQKREGDIFLDSLRTCLISPSAVMIRTPLFRSVGGFDETMTAAEDYDLWLRILREYPVGLVDEPLVTRRAGHPGQLSTTVPAIDRFRILTLMKLLATSSKEVPHMFEERRRAVVEVLVEKCRIYAQGLTRRGQDRSAAIVLEIAGRADEWRDRPDSHLENAIESYRALLRQQTAAWITESRGQVEMAAL
jgi:glycosyltransferase involved in cell wall biosynthesis